MRSPIIGVMGLGERAPEETCQIAYQLGREIALAGWMLLTGGRNAGVMAAASRGAKSANGLTIGILPSADRQHCSEAVDIAICTGMGNIRNQINVLSSDVVVACGMGAGTASEVGLALKANKPVILLHASAASQAFWRELAGDRVCVAVNVAEAISQIKRWLQ
jgi:uncharacterized protein (TIGR00725 family)